MENYHNVQKVKLKIIPNISNSGFWFTQTCLSERLLVSGTYTMSSTIKFSVRIGSAVFIFLTTDARLICMATTVHTTNLL